MHRTFAFTHDYNICTIARPRAHFHILQKYGVHCAEIAEKRETAHEILILSAACFQVEWKKVLLKIETTACMNDLFEDI